MIPATEANLTSTVNEAELTLLGRSNGVRRISIEETEEGRFRVLVIFMNDGNEHTLVTTRREPREWASLDRLAQRLGRVVPTTAITLKLCNAAQGRAKTPTAASEAHDD
jgi:hypothetical protein